MGARGRRPGRAGSEAHDIAELLTRQGVPSPSGYDPARNPHRNPHRDGRAWNKYAVRAILTNPRHTGYQVWNRQRRDEVLLDVHDVAAGYTSRMRWNTPEAWVWSEQPAHQPLVTRDTFDTARRLIASRTRPQQTRKPRATPRPYPLRGRLRCGLCQRCMQGHWVHQQAYYRCRHPAQYALATSMRHPKSVNLREADLLPRLDEWIGTLFDPANLDATCAQLATATNSDDTNTPEIVKAHHVIRDCDLALRRYRATLEQGANPETVASGSTAPPPRRPPPSSGCASCTNTTPRPGHRRADPRPGPEGRHDRRRTRHRRPQRPGGAVPESWRSSWSTGRRSGSWWPPPTSVGISRVSEGGLEPPRPCGH